MTTEVATEPWSRRALRAIPGGVPGFHRLFGEGAPVFLVRGEGAEVIDTDGRRYLDFVLGKGPMILGHGNEAVTEAVVRVIRDSPMLGLTSPVAIEAAEILLEDFPARWRIRFHKSGSEACAGAVRMARAKTGRMMVVSSGYHGWHDWCSPDAPGAAPTGGFADFGYDLARLEALLDDNRGRVAAVIVEPQPGFLASSFYAAAMRAAHAAGALFILDEVKSAYRAPTQLIASALDPAPDLVVLGKAISNGFCVSCVAGPEDLMSLSDRLHVGTTYDFETGALAAIRATVPILRALDVAATLCARAEGVAATLNQVLERRDAPARAFATGAGFRIGFLDPDLEAAFYEGVWKRGVLLYPFDNQFLSIAHDAPVLARLAEVVDETLAAAPGWSDAGWRDAADRHLHQFPNRKGFLFGAPGPGGTIHRASTPQPEHQT